MLDAKGAETLLGNGDMLLQYPLCMANTRVQGAFLSDEEKDKIVDFICKS